MDVPDLTADGDVRAALDKQKKKQEAARMGVNPETLEYGTKQAEIVSYYITDKNDVQTTAILKGDEFTMHMKVKIGQSLLLRTLSTKSSLRLNPLTERLFTLIRLI